MKPFEPYIGAIEGRVREARLVDGAAHLFETLARNAPVFCPEKRRFLNIAAGAAASAFLARLPEARATEHNTGASATSAAPKPADDTPGGPSSDWQARLMRHDPVYGPPLFMDPRRGKYRDFVDHQAWSPRRAPFGAVDYVASTGTPIVPAHRGRAQYRVTSRNAKLISVFSTAADKTRYFVDHRHLKSHSTNIDPNAKTWKELAKNNVGLHTVMGYSGRTGTPWAHLHLEIAKKEPTEFNAGGNVKAYGKWEPPGIDPFKRGLAGAKPIYYDGRTALAPNDRFMFQGISRLDQMLSTKSDDELEIDAETRKELTARLDEKNVAPMQDYLRHQVLEKHASESGAANYRFLPGSFMYSQMLWFARKPGQEIVVMLPFINPLVVDTYRKRNPGIAL